jgi:5-methylcytosine-specific restriction endonuclease McrA
MIPLERIRSKQAIPPSFRGKLRVNKALTLLPAPGAERAFDSKYWKKAKAQLKAETFGKCAYCEAPTSTVAYGDVEHFRPKSVYWWLAYCYDNYLFSCQICNQQYKRHHFPLRDGAERLAEPLLPAQATDADKESFVRGMCPDPLVEADGMEWEAFAVACRNEQALLLDPYSDDPELHFAWEPDAVQKYVYLRAGGAAAADLFDAANRYFGLNRMELLLERWRVYAILSTFHALLTAGVLSGVHQAAVEHEVRRMMQPDAPFAGMCRFFIRRKWGLSLD